MFRTDKIAILMATYNGEKYIEEQLDSILKQSNQNWVLYIHDDGSSDQTPQIILEYQNKYPDKICLLEGEKTGGAKNNFLYLTSQVEAPYYMYADQDDVWKPSKIELTIDVMKEEEKENPILVFSELEVVDENLNVIAEKMSAYQGLDCTKLSINRALIQNVVTGCTMMMNRLLRDEMLKGLSQSESILMHDWWAYLIAARFGKVCFIEKSTIFYRQHSDNGVGARNANALRYKIGRMFSGKEIRKSLINTRNQAKLFAELYEVNDESLVRKYAELGTKNKIERIRFYYKNDVKKSTSSKNLGLIMWG